MPVLFGSKWRTREPFALRERAGIREGLIRIAVGLEDVADLRADLARGLD